MNHILRFAISLFSLPIVFILRPFITKNKYLFYSPLGLKGNIKYLYDYYKEKGECCEFIDISQITLKQQIKLVFNFAKTRAVFLTHGLGRLPLACFLVPRVQLWHGFPLKNILLNSPYDLNKFSFIGFNKVYKLLYRLRIYFSYTYLVTSDSLMGRRLANSFRYNDNKVLFFGVPSQEVAESKIKKNKDNLLKILYLPTWRDGSDDIKDILLKMKTAFENKFSTDNEINLIIKLHPYELKRIDVKKLESTNVKFINSDVCDMVDFYSEFDCLITDYSSACFEFAPVSKSVIFYTPDIDRYMNNRGFDEHMNMMIRKLGIRDVDDLLAALLQLKNNDKFFALDYTTYVGSSKGCMESIYAKFK
ncbi:CDP-glycerol glycerophosphotransferase family protein [Pseudocitrobacter corydidari]|uniref:CDP-glycerol:poly(Glycerophosphate) glycerophosphotransferase n=1 Tax=Pseudocitrobacter corydidari TaxID=2891570 RepID=A0ABY3S2I1_9ENTR|nr:CDP-glycerol glycerophosphotransferase family protein [Pseudocitrobacter corydidari]UGS39895.1 hypothetical protein G163CM_05800 [Pseudocitrobacter corydidari]